MLCPEQTEPEGGGQTPTLPPTSSNPPQPPRPAPAPPLAQPLLIPGLLYVTGILLGRSLHLPLSLLFIGSMGLFLLTLSWARLRPWLLWPLVLLTGWTNFTRQVSILGPHDLRNLLGQQFHIVTVRGRLCNTPTLRVYTQQERESWRTLAQIEVAQLRLDRQAWQPATGRIR